LWMYLVIDANVFLSALVRATLFAELKDWVSELHLIAWDHRTVSIQSYRIYFFPYKQFR
jgi:hypothetical protein